MPTDKADELVEFCGRVSYATKFPFLDIPLLANTQSLAAPSADFVAFCILCTAASISANLVECQSQCWT